MKILGYIIVVKRSGTDGTPYPLTSANPSCSIGRGIECDIRVQLPVVSSQHCRIEVEASGKAYLTNISSSNPAYLNDVKLCPEEVKLLSHEDVILVADRKLRWEYPEESIFFIATRKENVPFKILTPKSKAPVNCDHENSSNGDVDTSNQMDTEEQIQEAARRKRVSFGRLLDPEHFDKQLPPSTPIRKGEKPDGCPPASPFVKRSARLSTLPSTPSIPEEVTAETPTKSLLRRRSPTPIKPYLARSLGLLTPKSLPGTSDITEENSSNGDADLPVSENSPSSSPINGTCKSSPQSSIQSPTLSSSKLLETPDFDTKTPEPVCLKSPRSVNTKTKSPGFATVKTPQADSSKASLSPDCGQSLTPSSESSFSPSASNLDMPEICSADSSETPESSSKTQVRRSSSRISDCKSSNISEESLSVTPTQKSSDNPDQKSLSPIPNLKSVSDTKFQAKREAKLKGLGASPALRRRKTEGDVHKNELNSVQCRQSLSVEVSVNHEGLESNTSDVAGIVCVDIEESPRVPSSPRKRCSQLEMLVGVNRSSPRKLELGKRETPLRKIHKQLPSRKRSVYTPKNTKVNAIDFPKDNTPLILFDETKTSEIEKADSFIEESLTKTPVAIPFDTPEDSTDTSQISEVNTPKTPKEEISGTVNSAASEAIVNDFVSTENVFSPEILQNGNPDSDEVKSSIDDTRESPENEEVEADIKDDDVCKPNTDSINTAKSPKSPSSRKSVSKLNQRIGSGRMSIRIMDLGKRSTPMRKKLKPISVKRKIKSKSPSLKTPTLSGTVDQPSKRKASLSPVSPIHKKMKVGTETPRAGTSGTPKSQKTKTPKMIGRTPKKSWADILKKGLMAHGIPAAKAERASTVMNKARIARLNRKQENIENCGPSFNPEMPKTFNFTTQSTGHVNSPAPIIIRKKIAKTPKIYRKGQKINLKQDTKPESIDEIDLEGLANLLNTPKGKDEDFVKKTTGWTLPDIVNHYTPLSKVVRMKELISKNSGSTPLSNIPSQGSKTPGTPLSSISSVTPPGKDVSLDSSMFSPVTPPNANTSRRTRSISSITNATNYDFCAVKTPDITGDNFISPLVTPDGTMKGSEDIHISFQESSELPVPVETDLTTFDFDNAVTPAVTPDVFVSPMSTRSKLTTPRSARLRKSAQSIKSVKRNTSSISETDETLSIDSSNKKIISDIDSSSTPKSNNSNVLSIKRLIDMPTESVAEKSGENTDMDNVEVEGETCIDTCDDIDTTKLQEQEMPVEEQQPGNISMEVNKHSRTPKEVVSGQESDCTDTDNTESLPRTPAVEQELMYVETPGRRGLRSSMSDLEKTPENVKEPDYSNVMGMKRLLRTPKASVESPGTDYSDVAGIKKLLKTPKATVSEHEADYTDVSGVRELLETPQAPKSVKEADYSNVAGMKRLLRTPRVSAESPGTDYSDVAGIKKLLKTTKATVHEHEADYTDVSGVRELLKTPRVPDNVKEPDHSSVMGMKRLLRTPRALAESPGTDYSDVAGVKKLMKTPKATVPEYEADYTDVSGVGNLLKTPRAPENGKEPDYSNVTGVKRLLRTPKVSVESPGTDYSDVAGIKKLMKTPKATVPEHEADYMDVSGVRELLETPQEPKSVKKANYSNDTGMKRLLRTPRSSTESPRADYCDVAGIEELIETLKADVLNHDPDNTDVSGVITLHEAQQVSKPDYSNATAVKRLSRTPKASVESSLTDDSDTAGMEKLMMTSNSEASQQELDNAEVRPLETVQPPDDSNITEIKEVRTTRASVESPGTDYSDVAGVRKLMKTPKVVPEHEPNYSDVSGVKQLLTTPKSVVESPAADYTNVHGLRKLLKTPKSVVSPGGDYSDVRGVKKLMKTPKTTTAEEETNPSNVLGLKRLLRTPKAMPGSPAADYTNVLGIKKLVSTPAEEKPEREADYSHIAGIRKVLRTPKEAPGSPQPDYTQVAGVKKLLSTPKTTVPVQEPDYTDVRGIKKLMATPRQNDSEPLSDYTNVAGLKKLLKTPTVTKGSPQADYTQVYGVRNLMRTPKNVRESCDPDLDGLSHLVKTPLSDTSNIEQLIDIVKESVSPAKQFSKTPVASVTSGSLSENIPPKDSLKTATNLVKDECIIEAISPRRSHRNKRQNKDVDCTPEVLPSYRSEVEKSSQKTALSETHSVQDNAISAVIDESIRVAASPLSNVTENIDTPKKSGRRTRNTAKVVDITQQEEASVKTNTRSRRKAAPKDSDNEVQEVIVENNTEKETQHDSRFEVTEEKVTTPETVSKSSRRTRNTTKVVDPAVKDELPSKSNTRTRRKAARKENEVQESEVIENKAETTEMKEDSTKPNGDDIKATEEKLSTPQARGKSSRTRNTAKIVEPDVLNELPSKTRGRRKAAPKENNEVQEANAVENKTELSEEKSTNEISTIPGNEDSKATDETVSTPRTRSVPSRTRNTTKVVDPAPGNELPSKKTTRGRGKAVPKENNEVQIVEVIENKTETEIISQNPVDSPVRGRRKRNVIDDDSQNAAPAKRGRGSKRVLKEEKSVVQEITSNDVPEVEGVISGEDSASTNYGRRSKRARATEQKETATGCFENGAAGTEEKTVPPKSKRLRGTTNKSTALDSESICTLEASENKENEDSTEGKRTKNAKKKTGSIQKQETLTTITEESQNVGEIDKSSSEEDKKSKTKGKKVQFKSPAKEMVMSEQEKPSPVVKRGRSRKAVEKSEGTMDEKSVDNKTARGSRRARGQSEKSTAEECMSQSKEMDVVEVEEEVTKKSGRQSRAKKTNNVEANPKEETVPTSRKRGSKRKDIDEQEEEVQPTTRRGNKKTKQEIVNEVSEENPQSPPKRASRRTRSQK